MSVLIRGRLENFSNVHDRSHHARTSIGAGSDGFVTVNDSTQHSLAAIVGSNASGGQDAAFGALPVSAVWTELTPGNNLDTPLDTTAFSGGASAFGRIQVHGGGHNNGMYDAKWVCEWSTFSTVGWVREVDSAADILAVDPEDSANDQISTYINANYTGTNRGGPTPGLYQRPAPASDVRLSVHTYDGGVATATHVYQLGGENPYGNPGQLANPWSSRTGTISRRAWGSNTEEFISNPLDEREPGVVSATLNTQSNDIWLMDTTGNFIYELFRFNTTSNLLTQITTNLNPPYDAEGQIEFDTDSGGQGSIWVGGGVGSANLQRYDIATNALTGPLIAMPANQRLSPFTWVPASAGANYGTLFALESTTGNLQRLDGTVWTTIATGGPTGGYLYERFGYDEGENIFFAIWHDGTNWRNYFARPYA